MTRIAFFQALSFLGVASLLYWRIVARNDRHRRWWAPPWAVTFSFVLGVVAWEVMSWQPYEFVQRIAQGVRLDRLWGAVQTTDLYATARDTVGSLPGVSVVGSWADLVRASIDLSMLTLYLVARGIVGAFVAPFNPWKIENGPAAFFYERERAPARAGTGSSGANRASLPNEGAGEEDESDGSDESDDPARRRRRGWRPWRRRRERDAAASYVLQRQWGYARAVFGTAAAVAFVVAFANVIGLNGSGLVGAGLGWSTLAFVVMTEFFGYLYGPLQEYDAPALRVEEEEDDDARPPQDTVDLLPRYLDRWPEWSLASGRVELPVVPSIVSERARRRCSNVGRTGSETVDGCCVMLDMLLEGRSVVVTDVLPHQVRNCLAYFLHDRVVRGQRVMVLVEQDDDVARAQAWLSTLLEGNDFTILAWGEAMSHVPTAVVATPHQNLVPLLNREIEGTGRTFGDELGLVIALDAHASLMWSGSEVYAVVRALADIRGEPPQVLALSDWRDGAADAFRNILGADVTDLQLAQQAGPTQFASWREEGVAEAPTTDGDGTVLFRSLVFEGDIGAYVSPDVALAYPASQEERPQVLLVQQQRMPLRTMLADAENARRVGQVIEEFAGVSLDRAVQVVKNDWSLDVDRRARTTVVVAHDRHHDLVGVVRKWAATAPGTATVVHVVSRSYLLRDFFAATLDRRVRQRRSFAAFAPSYEASMWNVAYGVYRRMERDWVDVVDLERDLLRAGARGDGDVGDRLLATLEDQLDLHAPQLEWRTVARFDPNDLDFGRFTSSVQVRLAPVSRESRPWWMQRAQVLGREISGGGQKVLATLFRGHIHQTILEGQVHAFDGVAYRVRSESTTSSGTVLYAESIQSSEYESDYVQHRTVDIDVEGAPSDTDFVREEIPNTARTSRLQLRLTRFDVPMTVHTHGYYGFAPESGRRFRDAPYRRVDVPSRTYKHGKILRARLIPEDSDAVRNDLAPTFAWLLSEMFMSYFPEAHPYLRVLPANSDDAASPTGFDAHMSRIVPPLSWPFGDVDAHGLTVFIVEDSPFDIGALATLERKLDDVVDVMVEYLEWYLQEGHTSSHYLRYGFDEVPSALRIHELSEFLRPFRGTRTRMQWTQSKVGHGVDDAKDDPSSTSGAGDEVQAASDGGNAAALDEEGRGNATDAPSPAATPSSDDRVHAAGACFACGRPVGTTGTVVWSDPPAVACRRCAGSHVTTAWGLALQAARARRQLRRRYGRRSLPSMTFQLVTPRELSDARADALSTTTGPAFAPSVTVSRPGGLVTLVHRGEPRARVLAGAMHALVRAAPKPVPPAATAWLAIDALLTTHASFATALLARMQQDGGPTWTSYMAARDAVRDVDRSSALDVLTALDWTAPVATTEASADASSSDDHSTQTDT